MPTRWGIALLVGVLLASESWAGCGDHVLTGPLPALPGSRSVVDPNLGSLPPMPRPCSGPTCSSRSTTEEPAVPPSVPHTPSEWGCLVAVLPPLLFSRGEWGEYQTPLCIPLLTTSIFHPPRG